MFSLNPWQITQVARHEDRPKVKYFIEKLDDFIRYQEIDYMVKINL